MPFLTLVLPSHPLDLSHRPCTSCFPGDAVVTLADGSSRQMADIRVGDVVQAIDPTNGELLHSAVYRSPIAIQSWLRPLSA
jgi:hypothetical protein